jgi:hypothetical protein
MTNQLIISFSYQGQPGDKRFVFAESFHQELLISVSKRHCTEGLFDQFENPWMVCRLFLAYDDLHGAKSNELQR